MKYFDGVHLVATSLEELHLYAQSKGIKRCWFQCAKTHPHYDVIGRNKLLVEKDRDVIRVSSKEILIRSKALIRHR
jgi:hypothetical protein